MVMNKGSKFAIGTALAAGVGYVAGILTAPKSGEETRRQLKNDAQSMKLEAEKKLKDVHSEIGHVIDEGVLKAKSASATGKQELNELVDQAKVAKTKVREVLSAVHEGGAEDADLDKAIKHAKVAVKNIKDYLKNAK